MKSKWNIHSYYSCMHTYLVCTELKTQNSHKAKESICKYVLNRHVVVKTHMVQLNLNRNSCTPYSHVSIDFACYSSVACMSFYKHTK